MNNKKRFKLYKSGKLWCIAAITVATLAMTSMNVHADANQDSTNTLTTTRQRSTQNIDYKELVVQSQTPQPAHRVINHGSQNAAYNENGGGASL